jgi:hypothetical protein
MNKKLARLTERRQHLVNRAAAQRLALARNIAPWHTPLALADRSVTLWHYIKRHPRWIIGGVVMLAALGPGRAGSWLGRGLVAWQLLDTLLGSARQPENAANLPDDSSSPGNSVAGQS